MSLRLQVWIRGVPDYLKNRGVVMENNLAWCGIDVSKETFDASILVGESFERASKLKTRNFKRTEKGVGSFVAWCKKSLKKQNITLLETAVVMESTGVYSAELADWILKCAGLFRLSVVNPSRTNAFSKSLGHTHKTDAADARMLAYYGRERRPKAYTAPSPTYKKIRDLSRHRKALSKQKTMVSNQLKVARDPLVTSQLNQLLDLYKGMMKDLEQELKALIASDEQLSHDHQLLETIYGVSFTTIITVFAELGDLRRYDSARKLSSMVGTCPRHYRSGTSVQWSGLGKQGKSPVRRILYMAALVAATHDPSKPMAKIYTAMIKRGKPKKVAICAVMRKLLVIMRSMLINNTAYGQLPEPSSVHVA